MPAFGSLARRRIAGLATLMLVVVMPTAMAGAASEMVRVPGGVTRIGADQGRPDERPAFLATVAPFELDRTLVTVAAFSAFVTRERYRTEAERLGSGAVMRFGTGQWSLVAGADWRHPQGPQAGAAPADHPVTQVSWNDAQRYCTAQGKRLPSEIEYEHAARGGQGGRRHAFGDQLEQGGHYRANVWTGVFPVLNTGQDGYKTTSPVGAYGPGPLGLSDLAGNVWEWTDDWYRPYAERGQPWPAERTGEKVQRGGSFLCDPKVCYGFRVTARGHASPESSHMHVGFRCARSVAAS